MDLDRAKIQAILFRLGLIIVFNLIIVSSLLIVIFAPPIIATSLGFLETKRLNFENAKHWLQGAQAYIDPINTLTNYNIQSIVAWNNLLSISIVTANSLTKLDNQHIDYFSTLPTLVGQLTNLQPNLESLQQATHQSKVLSTIIAPHYLNLINYAFQLTTALKPILARDSTWLVLFQNNNELRSTGGFMGSYALITLHQNQDLQINIEDIYDADGQFKGFVQAPPGVYQYLSGGKGMRLPDANWSGDFPTAAQQVLAYFALGDKSQIDGVIAINNQVLIDLLKITGPLLLPDYDQVLTNDTVDYVLHHRPQEFFPGSIQKKHLINQAQSVLVNAIKYSTTKQKQAILQTLLTNLQQKNILFFSPHQELESLFQEWLVGGSLPTYTNENDILTLIESNVGINKVNQWVSRTVSLVAINDNQFQIIINFENQSPDTKYLNYYRVITRPEWQLNNITGQDTSLHQENIGQISSSTNKLYNEIGFLINIQPQAKKVVTITLDTPSGLKPSLILSKQPGLSATPYSITSPTGKTQSLVLDSDRFITW